MLAETMAEVKAGRMDPKVANTVAYVGTVLLRAYETDTASAADAPTQPYVPLIYRALSFRDGLKHESDDVIDLNTGERVGLRAAEARCALPFHLLLSIVRKRKGQVCLLVLGSRSRRRLRS